jgi:hypothetical protein
MMQLIQATIIELILLPFLQQKLRTQRWLKRIQRRLDRPKLIEEDILDEEQIIQPVHDEELMLQQEMETDGPLNGVGGAGGDDQVKKSEDEDANSMVSY